MRKQPYIEVRCGETFTRLTSRDVSRDTVMCLKRDLERELRAVEQANTLATTYLRNWAS